MRLRRRLSVLAVIAGVAALIPASSFAVTEASSGVATVAISAAPAFTSAQLDANPGADWITNGGSVNNERYSTLNQINSSNVSKLTQAWHIHLNGSGVAAKYSAEATPIVYKGVMYIATGNDDAFALDATTGQQIWEYQSNIEQTINTACCGWDNRGLAIGGGLIYNAQLDGNLVALDQMTGGVVWKVPVFNWKRGRDAHVGAALLQRRRLRRLDRRRVRLPRKHHRVQRHQRQPALALLHGAAAG